MSANLYIRKPAVSGMFYPANSNALREQIANLQKGEKTKIRKEFATSKIIGGVVPHRRFKKQMQHN